ncbi:uncharacterized protein si:dkeyp-75h12.7 [Danio aesculapii]|uniref:uncharacterized protein si:dkeyp-75h12.7 n=1 Tax=Danio aesculapii TaxID=1142201 RepID=UPI0024BFE2CD|nr:uncharacterized protein si:dkeyp-75h12.7 [Danio aesculapii]
MPVALLDVWSFLLMLNLESVLSVCDVKVQIIDFGCHLEWNCPDANPETTYTVSAKLNRSEWRNVPGCIQISNHSCDLSHVFSSLNGYNFIRLRSEEQPWMNITLCDPMNDPAAKFSAPSINISVDNGSLWVTVLFPYSPSITCSRPDDDEEEEEEEEEEEQLEEGCPLNEFKSLLATVTLYNNHKFKDRQNCSVGMLEKSQCTVEFGFLDPGEVYCAEASFIAEGVLTSSPMSLPLCVQISANTALQITESLIGVIVCAVLITLGLVFLLLWRGCAPPERPLPRSLALLQDLELQKETLNDFCLTEPPNEISDDDHVSVVSFLDFTLTENQSSYQNTQSLGNGYYSSPVLQNPDPADEYVESGESGIEEQIHELHLFQSQSSLEGSPYQSEKTLNIPLSSVWVKNAQRDETATEEQCGELMWRCGDL